MSKKTAEAPTPTQEQDEARIDEALSMLSVETLRLFLNKCLETEDLIAIKNECEDKLTLFEIYELHGRARESED